MIPELNAIEARIIGSLMEKSVYTPDQYPLTLNALALACNQKSSRDPLMSLDRGAVEHALRQLEQRHLVVRDENFQGRVDRYSHRLCNTPFSELTLTAEEFAVICVLLLRGPQTPGEIRTRSGRLFEFADNAAVTAVLKDMMDRPSPLVARLPRISGRQDSQYAHLFSGAIESAPEPSAAAPATAATPKVDRLGALEARVAALEQALAELRTRN